MIIFLLEIVLIYFISRFLIKELFYLLSSIFKNNKLIYYFIAVIFLPGTLVHELAHFLTALLLLLPVKEMTVFPHIEEHHIKLGEVSFEKRDVLRGIIVGVAPLFFGTAFIVSLFVFNIFPNKNLLLNIVLFYLIFSVSSNMFSSRKDLEDLVYIIPVFILVAIILYVFAIPVNLNLLYQGKYSFIGAILNKTNSYLLYVLLINISSYIILKLANHLIKK